MTKDTTFVYCTYKTEAGSWANISNDTYLYNPETQEKFPILQSNDLPFSPQKREFSDDGTYQVSFSFSSTGDATRLDFIEDLNEEAFNIYGISLTNSFNTSYNKEELKCFSNMSLSCDTAGDTIKAIQYKEQEKEATAFIYGEKSEQLLMVVYDLCGMYEKYGFNQKANDQKKKITDYVESLNDNLEKWQLLSSLSNVLFQKNDYSEALEYSTRAVDIGEKIFGIEHPKYAESLDVLSINYHHLGNDEEAIRLGKEALEIRKKVVGTDHPDYAMSLGNLAEYYSDLGYYEEALRFGAEALEIIKKVCGDEKPDYAAGLFHLAIYYSELGNHEEAIRIGTRALEIIKKVCGNEDLDYATLLDILATFYSKKGNYGEAIRLGTEALEITKRILGTDHPDYATSLNNLAGYYSDLGDYEGALRFGTEALEIIKRVCGNEDPYYVTALETLAIYYSEIGNYEETVQLMSEAVKIKKNILGEDHPDYATSLNNLASPYSDLGNYGEAMRLGTEALEIIKKVFGTDHPDYAALLGNLATYYSDLGNYGEAIRLGTEALEIKKRVLGTDHPDYARSLNSLAIYYSDLGNYGEAIRLGTEALEIRKRVLGTDHPDYAASLGCIALYYSDLGNYGEAIRLGTEALEIGKNVYGTDHPTYATLLNNLATYYSDLNNYGEAIRLGTVALEIIKRVLGTEHPAYATSLNNLAGYHSHQGNYGEAIRLGTEALEIRKRVLGTDHPDYAASLGNIALYYSDLGNYGEAIRLETEALEIRKRVLGTDHPDCAISLGKLAGYHSDQGNYEDAYLYYKECIENSQVNILMNFIGQSSYLRKSFWEKYQYRYTERLPSYVYKYKNAESITELYDKNCLFAKGLLLNSDTELRKLILESEDSILIDKHNMLSTNINIYNKLIEKPINERFMNADSLNNIIQQQEMELARESKVYGDYTHNLTSTWKDVRSHLSTDDIAIEFIDFPILGTDSIMYVALTLKKDYDNPHMVTLFEREQLKAIPERDYYTQTSTYDLVWKPLEKELENIKNIYFSPSGELHRIGIEYVPINQTENMSDKYSLYRLSSTRQLAFIQDETKGEQNILYGGINYDESANVAPDVSISSVDSVRGIDAIYRSNVDSLLLRSSYEYLEGTKKEVDQIVDQMKQHQLHYQYYSGPDGSEESFKKLDGTKPRVMHIATHGFYLTEEEAQQSNFARPHMELMMGDYQRAGHPIEDKPMTRSGLLFSGCNHAIHHEQIPDGVEDGILTAQEISTLDLRGLELVVLSACQTALGDIASGEGVFGLQRGFKKAGAKTVVMSLWKVDDEATRILMVEFYNNLMSGKSKQQALKDAQKHLREYDNGKYNSPQYWAAFVMLDGLD
ncbi:MAG: tetratricopeptide repeat protein [Bacteroidaceae bacterium]|nr:tetratricopeptide repeat protein [Bacteroidaceae bacterium]